MRKDLNKRRYTLFSKDLNIDSKINLLSQNLNNQNEVDNIKRGSRSKYEVEFNINFTNVNKLTKKLISEYNLIHIDYFSENRLRKQRIEEHYEKSIKHLAELLTSKNTKNESKAEHSLFLLLNDKDKKAYEAETDKLIEIIKYILSKKEKTERDILVMKTYFSRIDKISSLFLSLNSENIFIKLLSNLNFEEYKENNVLFKEGDKGEKLYITLKGSSSVLVQKEGKDGMITQFEYIKYLIVLYLYQEMGMFSKILFYNKSLIKLKEACIITLLLAFRFYKFYKDQDFFLVENDLKYEDDSICDFCNNQPLIKEFIYKKLDFALEDSIHIFNYTQNIIKELYRFYERKIEDINQQSKISKEKEKNINISLNLQENTIEEEKQDNPKKIIHPSNFDELNIYGENIKKKFHSKGKKSRKKIQEDLFNKLFEIKEISKDIIFHINAKEYIQRLNFDNIIQDIHKDYYLKADKTFQLKEVKIGIRYLNYNIVNIISPFQIFGELALNSINKKRTATIITNDHCYFGVLVKKIYDSHLKVAQIKSRIRNILFFTEGPIFKGISPGIFLNEFFYYLNKKYIHKGQSLFNKGDKRNKIYFVENGEFELGCKLTLEQIGDIMHELGGISDNKKEKYLCDSFIEFKQVYENKNMNIKICILDKNYIIGLDDMCLDNKYLFDCRCVSTKGADVYEFDFDKYEKALNEFKIIYNNNIEYVNNRRETFIKILFEQRNSLVDYEYAKLIEESIQKEKMKEINYAKKFNILATLMKNIKYNKEKLINITKYKIKNSNKSKETINGSINEEKHMTISNDNLIKQFPSMKIEFKDSINKSKLSESESKRDNSNNKSKNVHNHYYPKISSDKNVSLNNFKTTNSFFENRQKKDIKNKRKAFYQLHLTENNKKNYDFTNTNLIFNEKSKNKMLNSLNIYINQTTTIEKRRKRNIIPIINKNKKRIKTLSQKKAYKIPSLFKEYSKEYSSLKTKIKKDNDNLYSDYQKNVYNIFYPKHSKKMLKIKTNENETEELFGNFTEKDFSLDKEITKRQKKDKSTCVNFSRRKILNNINDINYFDVGGGNKNKGIIDCLCFDNWAEKRQFEEKLLNYKIS